MLTDTKCRTAKPKEKLYRINDFNGLYLEVKPNGKKAWRFRFQINGKSSMLALGNYPLVTLAEARSKLHLTIFSKYCNVRFKEVLQQLLLKLNGRYPRCLNLLLPH